MLTRCVCVAVYCATFFSAAMIFLLYEFHYQFFNRLRRIFYFVFFFICIIFVVVIPTNGVTKCLLDYINLFAMRVISILIISILGSCLSLYAQDANYDLQEPVIFYGVDFSVVKVLFDDHDVEEFCEAFQRINLLFVNEADKYSFDNMVYLPMYIKVSDMLRHNSQFDYYDLHTYDRELLPLDIDALVASYSLSDTQGTGIVIVARLLDKPMAEGYYDVVMFDIASRTILGVENVIGKAGGFGLRNYWARSIREAGQMVRFR